MIGNPFNIVSLFFNAAQEYPTKIAIIDKDKETTFSEFERDIKDTANYFRYKGIEKGDRVLIFVPMSIDLYRIVLALFHIGATAVFLDEWVNVSRMKACCEVAQCKVFIGSSKARVLSFFLSGLRKIPLNLGIGYSLVPFQTSEYEDVFESDTALITFTTGSTGVPKAAKRTHGFLNAQFNALFEKIEPTPDDIVMPVLPIVLLINLGVGCTSVIPDFNARKPESLKPEKIVAQLTRYGVSRIVSSPFFIKRMAGYILNTKRTIPTLNKIITGGAPVFPSEAGLYISAFPALKIEIVYGSTEAEPISSIDAHLLSKESPNTLKIGLNVGVPDTKIKLRILEIVTGPIVCEDEASLDGMTLSNGIIGEIIVSGAHVLTEYFNNESAHKLNKIVIGHTCWHRTGDSGYLNEQGVLFLTGRCSSLIYSNGKCIAPFMYENFFQSINGVEMGTILEVDKKLIAVIELKKGAFKKDVLFKMNGADVSFDEVRFLTKIPRDPRHNSKIDYAKIKV